MPQRKSVETVEVLVRCTPGLAEFSFAVAADARLGDLREQIQALLARPALCSAAEAPFVGASGKAQSDDDLLASRRILFLQLSDTAARLKGVKEKTGSLADFDEWATVATLCSPRSVQACASEGVLPEELAYAPPDNFEGGGLPTRIAAMRYDFFEAFRQDVLAMVKQARKVLIYEEEVGDHFRGSVSLVGTGGLWAGPLSAAPYASVQRLFEGLRRECSCPLGGKLFEGPLAIGSNGHAERMEAIKMKTAPPAPKASEALIPGNEVMKLSGSPHYGTKMADPNVDSERVSEMIAILKRLPFGKNGGEQVEGLIRTTESIAVVQRGQNSKRLNKMQRHAQASVERMVEVAEAQKEKMEEERLENCLWREHVNAAHLKNRGELPKSSCKEINYNKAAKRAEEWAERRAAIAENALGKADSRNETSLAMSRREGRRDRRTADLKELQTITYARRWLGRRTRWSESYREVRQNVRNYETNVDHGRDGPSARIEDQKMRVMAWAEVAREMKMLRRDFQEMASERDKRRQAYRREAIASGLRAMALEAEEAEADAAALEESQDFLPAIGNNSGRLGWGSAGSSTMSLTNMLSPASKRIPRFDFPRISSDMLQPMALADTKDSHSSSAPDLHRTSASAMRA